jgi:STE24 endopeptidase
MALRHLAFLALMAFFCVRSTESCAQAVPSAAPVTHITVNALAPAPQPTIAKPFDPEKATNAYLARVSGAARARSDAYFEGGYLLLFVDTLYALVVAGVLLWSGISASMRNIAQGMTRSRFLQVPIYVTMFFALVTALTFPLTVYEQFAREHAYGLSNQNFGQWLGDFATAFVVGLLGAVIALTLLYSVIRATPRYWWAWGALVAAGFLAALQLVTPVFINPLFNHYQPLPESPIKTNILALAHANGIPANNVYQFDASRQSNRISANVSGFLGTTRISLTDNLLKRSSPAEIEAVLGHEMGHYVLDHQVLLITWFGLLYLVAFLLLDRGFRVLAGIFGGSWNVRSIDDPAGLPVLYALFSVLLLLGTPITNSIVRTIEAQADIFGLNASRQPDGFATAALKLSNYRKLDPGPLEEFVFYDHPSGRARIFTAMRWKAAHLNDPDIKAGPVSPQ